MIPIRLNWQRPLDGAEVISDLGPDGDPDLRPIRARSKRMEPVTHRIETLENPIALHFVNCLSDADFVAFLSRFGMLDGPSFTGETSCNVNYLRSNKDEILEILDLWRHPNSVRKIQYVNNLMKYVTLRPTFECTDTGSNHLMVEPESLLDLMMMEAVFAVEVGTKLARCARCSKAYLFGPMTGRRSHSVYCSDRCRVAAMRTRNASKVLGSGKRTDVSS